MLQRQGMDWVNDEGAVETISALIGHMTVVPVCTWGLG